MRYCLIAAAAFLGFASIQAGDQEKNVRKTLEASSWRLTSDNKNTESTVRFNQGKLYWSGTTVLGKDGFRAVGTSSRRYDFELIEKDKATFLALKGIFRGEKLESTVSYQFDGTTLILKGKSPDGIDLTGKWTAPKKKDAPKEKDTSR